MSKKKYSTKVKHMCSTCGIVTTPKGHLCTPVIVDMAYKCDYCGNVTDNPRHVCKPKAEKISFVRDG